jgi:uncharacterized protein (DUF305 family)
MSFTRTSAPSVLAVALAAVVLLAGCGGEGDDSTSAPAPAGTPTATPAESFNDADVRFAQEMIPHHGQALDMARLAAERSANEEVKKLAGRIEVPQATGDHAAMGHSMPGMMSVEEMAELEQASGRKLDRMFLEMMIRHHQGAIEMAEAEAASGENPQAKDLALQIATAQRAEITQMEELLTAV